MKRKLIPRRLHTVRIQTFTDSYRSIKIMIIVMIMILMFMMISTIKNLLAYPERGLCFSTMTRNNYNQQSKCHN
jgi:hypothetical protein